MVEVCFVETNLLDSLMMRDKAKLRESKVPGRHEAGGKVGTESRKLKGNGAKGWCVRKGAVAKITVWLHCGWQTRKKC